MFAQCEGQRSQMSSIMQGYKTDHDKNLEKKEKEIESLKQKLETLKNKHKKEVTVSSIYILLLLQGRTA